MQCVKTALVDAYLLQLNPKEDERGAFCRLFCSNILKEQGIAEHACVQVNLSDNFRAGTLRGMHFQAEPYLEAKIVYCLKGKVFDVIIDLRKDSPTYTQHFGVKLSAKNSTALYIPKGFAHGFLTLEDDSQLLYLMSDFYRPGYERGYRYDDPTFKIQWPFSPKILSERDQVHPLFKPKV